MLFYGDEVGYTNDYSYLHDPAKSYDNRWMHRPVIDWQKNIKRSVHGTVEERVFTATKRLLKIRKQLAVIADNSNLTWLTPHNSHVAVFIRAIDDKRVYCLFNFSSKTAYVTWYIFKEKGNAPGKVYDHWQEKEHVVGEDHDFLIIEPYAFCIMEPTD
jgi:amylosucrase